MSEALDVVVLVGMSGVGKSHQAQRLAAKCGAQVIDCDAEIAARLGDLVEPQDGEAPVIAVGRWMGTPGSAHYREREAQYLALEEEITRAAIERARAGHGRIVIDTTGSVVHLPDAVTGPLRALGRVVYLREPENAAAEAIARYRREPKPVVFGASYRDGDEPGDALARLLAWRQGRYAALAHLSIDARSLDAAGNSLRQRLGW